MMPDILSPPYAEPRAPIANIEAEQALLAALLINNGLIDRVADRVTIADFCEPVFGRLFDLIVALHGQGQAANAVTLLPYVKDDPAVRALGGGGYLATLSGNATAVLGAIDFAEQIHALAKLRRLEASLQEAITTARESECDIAAVIETADAALQDAMRGADTERQMTAGECAAESLARIGQPDIGVRCDIEPVDRLLGQLQPKSLTVVGGRPGMGKTAMALSYATGAARAGHGVLFVSLEMAAAELGQRMLAAETFFHAGSDGVPFAVVRDGTARPQERDMLQQAKAQMDELPLVVVDVGTLTTGRLASLVRRVSRRMEARGGSLDLVVVDYLQLLRPSVRTNSKYEEASEISRALKSMAKEQAIAIMALAQLSRETERRNDKRPMQSDLRDSGQIEQDADAILFLHRPEYYVAKSEPDPSDGLKHMAWQSALSASRGVLELICAKRRNGPDGVATGRFSGVFQAVTA